jgi:hypothetical protein
MPAQTDIREIKMGLGELLTSGLRDVSPAHAKMVEPLIDAIKGPNTSGNDKADLKALEKRVLKSIDDMDAEPVAEWAEGMLMQTYAISRTGAVPEIEDDDAADFMAEAETVEDAIRPG